MISHRNYRYQTSSTILTAVFFPNRHYYAKSMAIVSKESFRVHELVCGEEGGN